MTRDRDLLALLHEVDARLAAAAPSPRLAASLGAQLRGARPSLARRVGRPLALALAAGTAAVALGAALQRPATPEVSASSPAVDPAIEIVGDRSRTDGGIPERTPAEGHPPAPPRILAPLLREPPRRLAPPPKASPPAPHSSAAPPDARNAPLSQRSGELPEGRTPPASSLRARAQPSDVALPSTPGWVDALERPPVQASPSRGQLPSSSRGTGGAGVPAGVAGQKDERSAESSAQGPDGPATAKPSEESTSPQEETGCRTADDLTSEVEAMCDAQGLILGNVRLLEPCRDGGYRGIEHTCLDGEPTECWSGQLGDGFTCRDSIDLKDEAYITCRNQGGDLAALDYDSDSSGCGISENMRAAYTCCPAAEPLPSSRCWTSKLDHGELCQALPVLDAEVSVLCARTDQTLFHIGYGFGNAACLDGEAASALFTCCP
ncbi:hypothetical protein WMF11_14105 [Sorangium sp. So ce295]|uniref:hypothetical protein n=1 Tax=Sorangium sp. So ce295 TaxID=3133295 RepID=UPI003F6249DE